jgi:hypothetical protein
MIQLHYFPENRRTIRTAPEGSGYTAIDESNFDDDAPVGRGWSRFAAIADLAEKMREHSMLEAA